jgi:hypothetical protein
MQIMGVESGFEWKRPGGRSIMEDMPSIVQENEQIAGGEHAGGFVVFDLVPANALQYAIKMRSSRSAADAPRRGKSDFFYIQTPNLDPL